MCLSWGGVGGSDGGWGGRFSSLVAGVNHVTAYRRASESKAMEETLRRRMASEDAGALNCLFYNNRRSLIYKSITL